MIKRWILDKVMKKLWKSVTLQELSHTFESLPVAQRKRLAEEAKLLEKTELYEWLTKELARVAQKRLYLNSKTEEDMIFGKACLYNLDILTRLVGKMSKR